MVILDVLYVFALTSVMSLAVVDAVKLPDLHTIGDFLFPMDDKFDSIALYIPGINLVVAAVILAAAILMLAEYAVEKLKECKVFNPMKKFFGIRIK